MGFDGLTRNQVCRLGILFFQKYPEKPMTRLKEIEKVKPADIYIKLVRCLFTEYCYYIGEAEGDFLGKV